MTYCDAIKCKEITEAEAESAFENIHTHHKHVWENLEGNAVANMEWSLHAYSYGRQSNCAAYKVRNVFIKFSKGTQEKVKRRAQNGVQTSLDRH